MSQTIHRQADAASKISQIREHFRTQIRRGQLVAGDRLPPERELATTFGVNLSTINKAMAVLESEMLLDRQTSRGTYIHRDVCRGQVMVVFDTMHFANPELAAYYHTLLESLMKTVKAKNMRPIHLLGHGQRGDAFISSLEPQSTIWHHAAGVLAMAGLDDFQQELKSRGVPVVSFSTIDSDRYLHPAYLDMNTVVSQAYEHLVARGCQRIALMANSSVIEGRTFLPNAKGQLCFKADLLQAMPLIDTELVLPDCLTPQDGYQAMMQLWQRDNAFDGLIISNDQTTLGVGKAMRELQIQSPAQLKVVTHATRGVHLDFPLDFTKAQFDMDEICQGAFDLLYSLMLGLDDQQQVRFTAAIEQGQTT
ncbi:MAG: hypothetical protein CMJ19_00150 [Phycisphaeraceae bacterium]|nr:hypothetical protein [Phycisphaeraceae bacterium]